MAAKITYTLINPIKPVSGDGPDITEIEFHKPALGELRKNDVSEKHGQAEKTARILAAASGLPLKILDNLSWDDYQKIQEEIMDFLGFSQDK